METKPTVRSLADASPPVNQLAALNYKALLTIAAHQNISYSVSQTEEAPTATKTRKKQSVYKNPSKIIEELQRSDQSLSKCDSVATNKHTDKIQLLLVGYLILFCLSAPYTAISILYVEYVVIFDSSVAVIGFLPACYSIGNNLIGFALSGYSQTIGARKLCFIGAIVSGFAAFLVSWTTSIPQLIILYCILGAGCGLSYLSASSTLQQYFTKNRTMASAIAHSGFSTAALVFPPLTRYLIATWNWRYACALIACVNVQTAWLGMFLAPKHTRSHNDKLHLPNPSNDDMRSTFLSCCKTCKLMTNIPFAAFALSTTLFNLGYTTFFVHIVNKVINEGTSKQKAALIPSIFGISGIVGRLSWGVMTAKFPSCNRLIFCGSGCLGLGLSLFFLNVWDDFDAVCTFCAIATISIALVVVVQHAIVVDLVGIAKIFEGIGIIMLAIGVGEVGGPPLAGFIYDQTGSYDATFYAAAGMVIVASCLCYFIVPFTNKPPVAAKTYAQEDTDVTKRKDNETRNADEMFVSADYENRLYGGVILNSHD